MANSNNLKVIWDNISRKLTADVSISASCYEAWLSKLEPVCIHEGTVILCARNNSIKNRITERYLANIQNAAKRVNCPYGNFCIITPDEKSKYLTEEESGGIEIIGGTKASENSMTSFTLNRAYTFENFIVGNCNSYAAAAARAIVDNPGKAYNPLLIYGGVGLGKTHILKAIASEIALKNHSFNVLYTSADAFTGDFMTAISKGPQGNEYKLFKKKYNSLDVLIIDDIQSLAHKTSTQEALFHIFNDLYGGFKQIVLSCDRPLAEVKDIENRLINRFGWGITAEITLPDYETRCSILRTKAIYHNFNIDEDVIDYIASKKIESVRELEGMLQNVIFFMQLQGRIDNQLNMAKEALKDFDNISEERLTMKLICEKVALYYGIAIDDLVGKRKTKDLVLPRHVSMYLITKLLPHIPLTSIGQHFSGRDYTTVIYARDKIIEILPTNSDVSKAIVNIEGMILNK